MKKLLVRTVTVSFILSVAHFASAGSIPTAILDVSQPRGEKIVLFNTPQRKQEICVIPQHSQLGSYTEDDLETEKELCSYDFYGLTQGEDVQNMAICPKINSTNPGVLVMDIPEGWSREKFEAEKCSTKNDLQKTRAKFKQSVTCSYTPSILSYYHFSRFLDGAGRVPVAVLRTIEKERHQRIVRQGLLATRSVGGTLHKGWDQLEDRHDNPRSALSTFDRTGEYAYGALQDNIKNEDVYYEITGGGAYDSRYDNFVKKEFYQVLRNPHGILDILGSRDFSKVVQKISTLKDATDMILLDTLLTQNDRMYNQHFKWAWTWIENGEVKSKFVKAKINDNGKIVFKSAKDLEEKAKYEAKNAVMIKQMVLKDNDCGVRVGYYTNKMKAVHALDNIRHISGKTYTALLKLSQMLRDPNMGAYLKRETLVNDADLKLINSNVSAAAADLRAKCLSGVLKLDLDLESYFSANPVQYKCDL